MKTMLGLVDTQEYCALHNINLRLNLVLIHYESNYGFEKVPNYHLLYFIEKVAKKRLKFTILNSKMKPELCT